MSRVKGNMAGERGEWEGEGERVRKEREDERGRGKGRYTYIYEIRENGQKGLIGLQPSKTSAYLEVEGGTVFPLHPCSSV